LRKLESGDQQSMGRSNDSKTEVLADPTLDGRLFTDTPDMQDVLPPVINHPFQPQEARTAQVKHA
jgi:hypothetical protein